MALRCVIIDDELHSCESLEMLVQRYCDSVEVLGTFTDPRLAVDKIPELRPDLLFLDILMPSMTGFDFLERIAPPIPQVIFVTAHDEYALKAIKSSALDYLLKPVDIDELQAAVRKADRIREKGSTERQLSLLREHLSALQAAPKRIALSTLEGLQFVETKLIVRCEAEGNYTNVYLLDKSKVTVSRSLIEFEKLLGDFHFSRVHNSHLINVNHIVQYHRGDGGYLLMADGATVDVSRRRKDAFLKKLDRI